MQQQYLYIPEKINSLRKTISPERLSTYQKLSGGNTIEAIKLYYWNMNLGQSLYIPIQSLEISLRNTISNAIKNRSGSEWYSQKRFTNLLDKWGKDKINKAIKKANNKNKGQQINKINEGDIIANLSFGFSSNLLKKSYTIHIWNKELKNAFPNLPNNKNNEYIYREVEKIVELRNRISHHEPIINQNLNKIYELILNITSWICLDTKEWVDYHCNFKRILNNYKSEWKPKPKIKYK